MDAIRIIYHHEPPYGWWAESPDLPGWSAAGATFEATRALAEEGVAVVSPDRRPIEHYVPEQTVAGG